MTSKPVFQTVTRDIWGDLDRAQRNGELEETAEEAAIYDAEVVEGLTHKLLDVPDSHVPAAAPHESVDLPGDGLFDQDAARHTVLPEDQVRSHNPTGEPGPSRSGMMNLTPHRPPTATPPHIATPSNVTPRLPDPPARLPSTHRPRIPLSLETPAHIDSPKDTPRPSGPSSAQQPDTPAPIGTNALIHFQGKKDLQTLTKTFEAFNKDLAKMEGKLRKEAVQKKGKSKGKALSKAESAALGGKALDGLRFCIPPEVGRVAKHKQRWGIVGAPAILSS